jgi:site-specific recombinase XerD
MPNFAEYARGWRKRETCAYLKKRRKRHNLTQAYADNNKKNLKKHRLPYFGKMPVHRITRDEVENRLDNLIERDCQNTTVNGYPGTLKTMLIEAAARKIIPANPVEKTEKPVNDRREIRIISNYQLRLFQNFSFGTASIDIPP